MLRKVKSCCKELEADKSATMQLVVSSIYNLTGHLEDVTQESGDKYTTEFARVLLKSIMNRFPKYSCMIALNRMGHYLNPLHKGLVLRVFDIMFMKPVKRLKFYLPSMTKHLFLQPEPDLQLQMIQMKTVSVSRLLNGCTGKEKLLLMAKRTVRELKEP